MSFTSHPFLPLSFYGERGVPLGDLPCPFLSLLHCVVTFGLVLCLAHSLPCLQHLELPTWLALIDSLGELINHRRALWKEASPTTLWGGANVGSPALWPPSSSFSVAVFTDFIWGRRTPPPSLPRDKTWADNLLDQGQAGFLDA